MKIPTAEERAGSPYLRLHQQGFEIWKKKILFQFRFLFISVVTEAKMLMWTSFFHLAHFSTPITQSNFFLQDNHWSGWGCWCLLNRRYSALSCCSYYSVQTHILVYWPWHQLSLLDSGAKNTKVVGSVPIWAKSGTWWSSWVPSKRIFCDAATY